MTRQELIEAIVQEELSDFESRLLDAREWLLGKTQQKLKGSNWPRARKKLWKREAHLEGKIHQAKIKQGNAWSSEPSWWGGE